LILKVSETQILTKRSLKEDSKCKRIRIKKTGKKESEGQRRIRRGMSGIRSKGKIESEKEEKKKKKK
jgi:hypothetical protein